MLEFNGSHESLKSSINILKVWPMIWMIQLGKKIMFSTITSCLSYAVIYSCIPIQKQVYFTHEKQMCLLFILCIIYTHYVWILHLIKSDTKPTICFRYLKLPSLFAAWLFWTFHTKSHNMKALVFVSHSWSPILPLTCLYGKKWTLINCVWPSGVFSWEKKLPSDCPCKSHDHDHQWAVLVMAWLL